jgi:membrane associated rhomboid family serine protease
VETAIRATGSATEADEWALVLAAAGIPHRVETDGAGWTLLVPASEAPRAHGALDAYDEEARREPDAALAEPASRHVSWAVGVAAGALLLAFFALTGGPAAGSRWFERGAASARRMVSGEPWRAVTALTLHVDAVHVAGNAVATVVLLPAVVQRVGPGCGVWLVLLAGAGANLLGAMAHDPRHVAVGASTATFGAIGILAALRLLPSSAPATMRWKPWMVLVTSLLLLAMLGAGRGSDVLGHALGLLSGGALGLAAGTALRRPLGPSVQWTLVALAALAIVGCWRLALAGVP